MCPISLMKQSLSQFAYCKSRSVAMYQLQSTSNVLIVRWCKCRRFAMYRLADTEVTVKD